MFYGKEEGKPERTVQIQLSFGEHHLYFIGLRLGYLHLLSSEALEEELKKIGPEPLDLNFSMEAFLESMKRRKAGLKATLVNQECIAGIGSRYSDEILWHAQLLPNRRVQELNRDNIVRLYHSIRFILQHGIQNGGYMDEPLFKGDNRTGGYKNLMFVHGRAGEPCKRCGATIVKEDKSSRKTFYCNNCQH